MKLILKRTLEEERLTQQRIFDMRCDETLVVRCAPDAAAWKTAERVAYLARQNAKRQDGFVYKIDSSALNMTVTITLCKDTATQEA